MPTLTLTFLLLALAVALVLMAVLIHTQTVAEAVARPFVSTEIVFKWCRCIVHGIDFTYTSAIAHIPEAFVVHTSAVTDSVADSVGSASW